MTVDHESVRAFVAGGGEYRKTTTSGINFATGQQVVGIAIATRGRVKPLGRWHKEFTLYATASQTLDDLHHIFAAWASGGDGEGTGNDG